MKRRLLIVNKLRLVNRRMISILSSSDVKSDLDCIKSSLYISRKVINVSVEILNFLFKENNLFLYE